MLNLFGIIITVGIYLAVMKYHRYPKVKEILDNLFWREIFFAKRNDKKIGITWFRRVVILTQFMYIFGIVGNVISFIKEQDITFLLMMVLFIIAWPLMFRAVIYIQRKVWGIH
ncbi:hypothetical protein HZI73_17100 [Vallitalea pronyensis]|uniref:Uncharacterized protein n=1 Tax=Vallitalea pronyensis TaxID=1348613 RepID=A0A8J8MLW1_9FIRM|nr:hypothetical protein [Vallitalea pronyensis]QUI23901.1 hypothetical protein HZI73_17100 [Vallitalea pronyensis]